MNARTPLAPVAISRVEEIVAEMKAGAQVNLEIDTVARYVERMLQAGVLAPSSMAPTQSTYSKDTAE